MGKLTAKAIASIIPTSQVQMISHGDGIALRVSPYNGAKHWKWRYRWDKKQNDISLGEYDPKSADHVSIKLAEERALECRKLLKAGKKPFQFWNGKQKEAKATIHTFRSVGDMWFEDYKKKLTKKYSAALERRLHRLLYPKLGKLDIKQISSPELLAVIKEIEKSGSIDLARRMKAHAGQIFQFAQAHGFCGNDPSQGIKAGLAPRPRVKHNASLKEHELPDFFEKLKRASAEPITKLAIMWTMLTAARTRETRFATKDQIINLDSAV